ncbi:hypothetical protein D3C78_1554020 [compost metagenome]
MLDSIEELGVVNGTEFVSFTGTDCSYCIVADYELEDIEPAEADLMKKDWEKVSRMIEEKDLVLSTFQAID